MTERWDGFHVHWDPFGPGMGDEPTPEENLRLHARYEWAKSRRAEIIEATIFVESFLDSIIELCVAGASVDSRGRFRRFVLSAEFCTLFQKWKILRSLFDEEDLFKGVPGLEHRKENLRALHDLIEIRNVFAHSELSIERETGRAFLNYFANTKTFIVSEESIAEVLSDAQRVHQWLQEMYFYMVRNDE